ncbi:MAG: acetyltransferase [Acidimicrobiia bacterium]
MSLFIAGAGGFGRETLDAVIAGWGAVDAFFDEVEPDRVVRGVPVRHPDTAPAGHDYVVGIADPAVRRRLVSLLDSRGLNARSVIHPRATIAPDTGLGPGCVVLANAYVSSSVTVGAHVQVNYNATIGHDCTVEDFASIYPGANVGGGVTLAEGSTVGSGAVVRQRITIGAGSFVGAGAVVVSDVPEGVVAYGVPARVIRPTDSQTRAE